MGWKSEKKDTSSHKDIVRYILSISAAWIEITFLLRVPYFLKGGSLTRSWTRLIELTLRKQIMTCLYLGVNSTMAVIRVRDAQYLCEEYSDTQ